MLLIFSTVLNALRGSLVFNRITRSKRPVTGVTDSMLVTRLSWLTMCPSSPFAFAKTKLVDADLDIFSLKSTCKLHAICQRLNPAALPPVTLSSREVLETESDYDGLPWTDATPARIFPSARFAAP